MRGLTDTAASASINAMVSMLAMIARHPSHSLQWLHRLAWSWIFDRHCGHFMLIFNLLFSDLRVCGALIVSLFFARRFWFFGPYEYGSRLEGKSCVKCCERKTQADQRKVEYFVKPSQLVVDP